MDIYFIEMSGPYRRALLWHKIRLCGVHFDFSKDSEKMRRDIKQSVLVELIDLINSMP